MATMCLGLAFQAETSMSADKVGTPASEPGKAGAIAREAESLYRKGSYTEALKKYEEAFAAGHQSAAALYQAANCYKAALSDETREIEMKKKAIPLLEAEIASGQAGLASYYYLAAIYVHSLHDAVKGVEVARKGVALVEKPGAVVDLPAENLYRAARLHEFLGQDDKAAVLDRRFQEAASVSPTPVERDAVRLSREKLAAHYMRRGQFAESAAVYEALVEAEPLRDQARHQWGLALLRGGKPEKAAAVWRGAASDEYRTELAYLEKVASRYAATGKPASSQKFPDVFALSDEELARKIVEAGGALRPFKQAAESAAKEAADKGAEEAAAHAAEMLKLSTEERKARWLARRERLAREGGMSGADEKQPPSAPSAPAPHLPEKSPEWLAAEREFFYLLSEYVKRGHLIRMYCFQNGIADLVFR